MIKINLSANSGYSKGVFRYHTRSVNLFNITIPLPIILVFSLQWKDIIGWDVKVSQYFTNVKGALHPNNTHIKRNISIRFFFIANLSIRCYSTCRYAENERNLTEIHINVSHTFCCHIVTSHAKY